MSGRMWRRHLLVVCLLQACIAHAVWPEDVDPGYLSIEAVPPDELPGGHATRRWTLYLDGYFEARASQRLAEFVDRLGIGQADVYFNSPGGSLIEGMAIGRLLRQRGYESHVGARTADAARPASGVCYSACPFAFAGGTRRHLDANSALGVHRAENRVPVPDEAAFERRLSQQATAYLAEMGVSRELFAMMSDVPQDQIRLISLDDAERMGLVNAKSRPR